MATGATLNIDGTVSIGTTTSSSSLGKLKNSGTLNWTGGALAGYSMRPTVARYSMSSTQAMALMPRARATNISVSPTEI